MVILAPLLLSLIASSHATLGKSADAVEHLRKAFHATRVKTLDRKTFTVQVVTKEGALIREYLNSGGVVFAVTWAGDVQPDLAPILGERLEEFSLRLAQGPRRRGRFAGQTVKAKDFVVETFGHMRAMRGRAYIPSLFPAGMTANEID